MRSTTRSRINQAITVVALFCMTTQTTFAALLNFAQAPLFIGSNIPPKVMLAISKDQQLFKKAYNDYSDLDGDGTIETSYKHSIPYYGYFDYAKCYVYNSGSGRFEPQSVIMGPDPKLQPPDPDAPSIPVPATCSGQWSGNFLNWISMTRMDAVRKLLYGGLRYPKVSESASETVLERAFVPTDAHAWAKYYNPGPTGTPDQPPIEKLTPFAAGTIPTTTTPFNASTNSPVNLNQVTRLPFFDMDFSARMDTRLAVGDQVCVQKRGSGTAGVCNLRSPAANDAFFIGAVLELANGGTTVRLRVNAAGVAGNGASSDWTVTNLSNTGISFCNLTTGSASGGPQSRSATNTNAPIIRVAKGNYALWNANERWQCQWAHERNNTQAGFGGIRSNGNQASLSEIYASAENPSQADNGLGSGSAAGEYIVRVQVCVQNTLLHGTERCKQYPNGTYYKPIGMLQQYGDDQRVHFGLMTGSFMNNTSGGVLRKNIGTFTDEIRTSTNGTINTAVSGIIATLNNLKIYGYNYIDGSYLGGGGDNCTFQQNEILQGTCTSWGNPMSEVFYEALRYFAGKKGTPSYQYISAGSKDAELGLPVVPAGSWTDPITPTLYCARMNVLTFNSSVSTHDDELRTTTASDINSSSTIGDLTSKLGALEGIKAGDPADKPYFIGKVNGQSAGPNEFELCTPKAIPALGDASGICPEGPTVSGSYLMAGAAWHAHVNRIRTDITPGASQTEALKVTSYAVQLATNTPQLTIPVPAGDKRIMIQPIYRLDLSAAKGKEPFGGGALVDLKIVRQDALGGKAYITWEDSEQGGDYDQDMWGTLEWKFDASGRTVTITTNAVSASTINPQGFGYTINGTSQDGPHFHSGILGFDFADPSGVLGCTNCNVAGGVHPVTRQPGQQGPQSVTYTIDQSTAGTLKDPMWYAAKYGGFKDSDNDGVPNQQIEWDAIHNISGDTLKTDGDPDNYFLVTNPLKLEEALNRLFQDLTGKASASSVASNSTSLKTTSAIYNARFDAKDWSGDVRAFPINLDGSIAVTPAWEASQQLPGAKSRTMLTYNPVSRRGVTFAWPQGAPGADDIPAAVINNLNTNPDTGAGDSKGSQRLDWLRGDQSREGLVVGMFRPRQQSRLGDIVNSNPVYVDSVPNDVNLDASYRDFRTPYLTTPRTPMIYIGGNDGALHGYDATINTASGGVEKLAYFPSKTASKLNALTSQAYTHRPYVDASPAAADVQRDVGGPWSTVLVGGLGAGGQGLYALDITDPSRFSEGNKSTVLWEFNDTDDRPGGGLSNFGLGYVFGTPVIRKMANDKWAVIVSGGYNNSQGDGAAGDGHAYLYIIFLKGPTGASGWLHGTDYIRIDTGTGTTATPNGLAPPFAADVDADGKVDFVYAGDMLGNFWKFDVSSRDPRTWTSASSRVRMFIARSAAGQVQPITSRAEGTPHPSGNGFVLTFGTGKYIEPTDPIGPYRNETFYGVWDKNDKPGNISAQATRDITRSRLFEQVIVVDGMFRSIKSRAAVSSGDPNARGTPDWATDWGWYMDFPSGTATGERSVFTPLLLAGRLIFTTLIPSGGACDFGGTSFLMVVSPSTGAGAEGAVLDVNGDRVLNTLDQLRPGVYASGVQSAVGITPTPTVIAGRSIAGAAQNQGSTILGTTGPLLQGFGSLLGYMIIAGSSGNMNSSLVGLSNNSGRVSWREVIKD